jgi:hypothetical protein
MYMASSMLEYLTVQNSGSMNSLTEFWVGYERLWISRLTEQKTANKDILLYLDDFPFGAEADSPKCQFILQTFRDICK